MNDMTTIYLLLIIVIAVVILFVYLKSKNQDASPVDPIAEAEVYLAYGRKSQAIDILEKAKLAYPDRADIQAKLNEIRIKQ